MTFGEGAEYEYLKSLSDQNFGFARKIYEGSDTALQVTSLYDEISAVSIKDMSITYQKSSVDGVLPHCTETDFPMVFGGSEIVVCGHLREDTQTPGYQITGIQDAGDINIRAVIDSVNAMVISTEEETVLRAQGFLWHGGKDVAYPTIQQLLLEEEKHVGDSDKVRQLEKKVLDMLLKYNFVTPLTSMMVTNLYKRRTAIRAKHMEQPEDFDNPDTIVSDYDMFDKHDNTFQMTTRALITTYRISNSLILFGVVVSIGITTSSVPRSLMTTYLNSQPLVMLG